MASRSLGVLSIDLVAKTFGFEQGMDKAARTADKRMKEIEARAKKFGIAIGTALAAGATAAANQLRVAINNMDDLSKAAQRVSLPTEQFSGLVYAGKLADVEVNTLVTSLGRLTKAQADAEKSTSEQARVFDALKIATKDVEGNLRSSIDVLYDFADAFERQKGSPEIVAAGIKIFGRSFQELIPLIKDGSEGLRGAAEEAEAFGQIISTETGQAAEAFNDNLSRLGMVVSGLANAVAAELLPDLRALTDEWVESAREGDKLTSTAKEIADAIRSVIEWMQEGSQVGASFRETLAQVSVMAAAARDNLSGIFSLDRNQVDQSRQDFIEAGKKAWDAAIHGVEQGKAERPALAIIDPESLLAADQQRVAQMRAAAAEAERLRTLAFGDAPKKGGGSKGGKSEAQKQQEEALKASKEAREELRKQLEAVSDAQEQFDALAAQLAGPMAQANYQFAVDQQRLNDLASTGEISTSRLAEAQSNLRKEYEETVQAIEDQLNPAGQLIKDMEFELALIGMTNLEREKEIALRYAGAAATDEQRARIGELVEAQRQASETAERWDAVQSSLANSMYDAISGAESLKDAVKGFFDELNAQILRMITEGWAEQITDLFRGTSKGSGTGSSGGIFERIMNWFTSLSGKATGGPFGSGNIFEVNESGMEMATVRGRDYLLTGNSSGTITPAHKVGGGMTVNQNFINPVMADRRSDTQREAEAARRLRRVQRYA